VYDFFFFSSQVRFGGQLTPQAIQTLRLLKDAFGVVFKIKSDIETLQEQREQQREFFAAKRRKVSSKEGYYCYCCHVCKVGLVVMHHIIRDVH
jgi:hypothetical protein